MNEEAIRAVLAALIADLYTQVGVLSQENAELKAALRQQRPGPDQP